MNPRIVSLTLAAILLLTPALLGLAAERVESYGKPWLTSIVDGMVMVDLPKPDLRDDFFLSSNYDWLRDTVLKPGRAQDDGIVGLEDLVADRVSFLFTDGSITGGEREVAQEFYQMFLDWDSHAEGWEFFLGQLQPIRIIATLEGLTAYLTGEESVCRYGPRLSEANLCQKAFYEMSLLDEAYYREYQKLMAEYQGMDKADEDENAAKEFTQTYLSQFVDVMYVKNTPRRRLARTSSA